MNAHYIELLEPHIELPHFKCACMGGTFDLPFHIGHEYIIDISFAHTDFLVIRVTSDAYLRNVAKKILLEKIHNERERMGNLHERLYPAYKDRFEIMPLDDLEENCKNCKYGERTEALFFGPDCLQNARYINEKRKINGLGRISLVRVQTVLASDGKRISSSRVRQGEIDKYGNPAE